VAHGAGEIGAIEVRRQLDHAHHEAWVGEADAHVARQLVLGEERAQLAGQRLGVDDLAVDHETDRKGMDDGAARAPALGARGLHDDDRVGADVEGDRRRRSPRSAPGRAGRGERGDPHDLVFGSPSPVDKCDIRRTDR